MIRLIEEIKANNPHVPVFHIEDHKFRQYGRTVKGYDFSDLISCMDRTDIPEFENTYVPSVDEMEETIVREKLEKTFYGGMKIQIGYCNGRNSSLNGLEYHKGSEINIAVTDMILLLGKVNDIHDNRYDVEKIEAFYVPRGTSLEMFQTTLHFAPCKVWKEGFKCIVVLPHGTNQPLEESMPPVRDEDELLFMKNKWLLAHPERKSLIEKGAYPGIVGENIKIEID
ncbi:MAG TPA: DUF4867 family protein [Bacillales bacterium]